MPPLLLAHLQRTRARHLQHAPQPSFPPALLLAPSRAHAFFFGSTGHLAHYFSHFHFHTHTHTNAHAPASVPLGRPFARTAEPSLPFPEYLERVHKYCQPEPMLLLAIIIYSERLRALGRHVPPAGWHRWALTACLLASKALNGDQFWSNAYWAKVGGISPCELLHLEMALLLLLDWHLAASCQDLARAFHLCLALP